MKTIREIVDAYEKADISDRTLLFLTYRDLRDVFMDIEKGYLSLQDHKRSNEGISVPDQAVGNKESQPKDQDWIGDIVKAPIR